MCSRCGGRAGWKRAAPSIFVPGQQSWLEGHEVAESSGDPRSVVWLSKLSAPTNASPHDTGRGQQPRPLLGPCHGVEGKVWEWGVVVTPSRIMSVPSGEKKGVALLSGLWDNLANCLAHF